MTEFETGGQPTNAELERMTMPVNRLFEVWKGDLWSERYIPGDFPRQVLVTRYGDGSMQVAWRPNPWSTWSPPMDMEEA